MIFNVSAMSPILLELGPIVIRWYAIAYILGFVFGWKYCITLIKEKKAPMTEKAFDDLLTWLVVGVILGGRLGYVLFYQPAHYLSNPIDILKIWEGGMSFHGGALGVLISIAIFANKNKLKFLGVADLICAAAPLGLFFGRWANFINNELWGKVTNGKWGVIFRDATNLPRHPSQLYDALLEGLVLFIVLNLAYRKKSDKAGFVSGMFLMLYGVFRAGIEFFREPDVQIGYILNYFTMGQVLSLPMIVVGLWLMLRKNK